MNWWLNSGIKLVGSYSERRYILKAITYERPNTVTFKNDVSMSTDENMVRVKVSHAGICGTDLNIFAGTHPRAKAPLIIGHEFSGVIAAENKGFQKGMPVTVNPLYSCGECLTCRTGQKHVCENLKLIGIDYDGGMAEYVEVPAENIVPLPAGISLKSGALTEPVAVAVHAVRECGYKNGDNAVVFGAGTIGLCTAITLRKFGVKDPVIIETSEYRIKKAEELGFIALNPKDIHINEYIRNQMSPSGADYVFDCAGHPTVAKALTEIVKVKGKIIIVAAYKKPTEMNLLQGMFKELLIQFVRVYTPKDFQIAAQLLNGTEDFNKIITHVLPPEEAEKGFSLLTIPSDAVKVMYQFDGGVKKQNE